MAGSGMDTRELEQFARQLAAAPARAQTEVKKAIQKGAFNIKNDAKQRFRSQVRGRYLPHYARDITYATDSNGMGVEIGPLATGGPGRQGVLGRGIEFGSSNHAPIPHMLPAADEEEPRFLSALRRALLDGLE